MTWGQPLPSWGAAFQSPDRGGLLCCSAIGLALLLCAAAGSRAGEPPEVAFRKEPDRLVITVGTEVLGQYRYRDAERNRVYYANVRAPGGILVTVPQPLGPGDDDHHGYHPGIWICYGDLSGRDYWRKRDRLTHDRFVEPPRGGPGRGSFTVRNLYLDGRNGPVVCSETVRHTILVRPDGYLLMLDALYRPGAMDVVFGDQQEMGLGIRMNTPLNVDSREGGRILDSKGRINEERIWGRRADWCDYSGPIAGRWAGITLMAHPDNFRPCRFHARDYGCMVANPFGQKDFGRGGPSRVTVRRGRTLRLRWGVYAHSSPSPRDYDPAAAFALFQEASRRD